jgi:hypothetical protein
MRVDVAQKRDLRVLAAAINAIVSVPMVPGFGGRNLLYYLAEGLSQEAVKAVENQPVP